MRLTIVTPAYHHELPSCPTTNLLSLQVFENATRTRKKQNHTHKHTQTDQSRYSHRYGKKVHKRPKKQKKKKKEKQKTAQRRTKKKHEKKKRKRKNKTAFVSRASFIYFFSHPRFLFFHAQTHQVSRFETHNFPQNIFHTTHACKPLPGSDDLRRGR